MSTQVAPFCHVYRLSATRLFVLPGVCLLTCGPLFLAALSEPADSREALAFSLTAALVSAIFLPFVWITWCSRLVVTHEGLVHHQLGYTVRSRWDNLRALSLIKGAEALYLHEPGTRSLLVRESAKLLAGGASLSLSSTFGDPRALAEGRLIFLAPFMRHFERGPLREDLARCAPALFETQLAPQARVPSPAARL